MLLLFFVTILTLQACSKDTDTGKAASKQGNTKNISLVTDYVGLNDKSINDQCKLALEEVVAQTGVKNSIVESESEEKYKASLEKTAKGGATLIFANGYAMKDPIYATYKDYKGTTFVNIDNIYDDKNMPKNIAATQFRMEDASYLAGYLAGSYSSSNKVAYIGGAKGAMQDSYEYGFIAGVKDAAREKGTDIVTEVRYADTFSDDGKGYIIAKNLYEGGCDVIYEGAGYTGIGAIKAAKEANKYIIAEEVAQIDIAPENVLTAVEKKYDVIVKDLALRHIAGDSIGGKNYEYGVKEGALGIYYRKDDLDIVGPDLYSKIGFKQKEIEKERIIPPYSKDVNEDKIEEKMEEK